MFAKEYKRTIKLEQVSYFIAALLNKSLTLTYLVSYIYGKDENELKKQPKKSDRFDKLIPKKSKKTSEYFSSFLLCYSLYILG